MSDAPDQSTPDSSAHDGEPEPSQAPAPLTADEVNALKQTCEAVDFRVEILGRDGARSFDHTAQVRPASWFAVALTSPPTRRYQYLLQWTGTTKPFVLCHLVDGQDTSRLPHGLGWLRAQTTGALHVISSDQLLSRHQLDSLIGGHEPPPSTAKPPYL